MTRSARHTKRAVTNRVAPPTIISVPFRLIMLVIVVGLAAAMVAISIVPVFFGVGMATSRLQGRLDAWESTYDEITFAQSSVMYDSEGAQLASLHGEENRQVIENLDQVSKVAQDAVLAIEDHDFYNHGALDTFSIMRAVVANLNAGEITQGGSTITQQLVKNALIGDDAQTFERKFQEAALAARMEREFDKDEILALYLNEIYLGNGIYGIGTASHFYFNKPSGKLKLAEAALLAGMIQAPETYNPISDPNPAKDRRNVVLDQMATYGFITQAEADKAKKTRIRLSITPAEQRAENKDIDPFFVTYARRQLLDIQGHPEFDIALGETYEQREQSLFQGGLKIYTTYDQNMQSEAQQAADKAPLHGGQDTAIATVQVQDQPCAPREPSCAGAVRVLLSGRDFLKDQIDLVAPLQGSRKSVLGIRQPGSAFKPFTLAAAFRQHIPPTTTFSSASPWRSTQWNSPCNCVYNAEGASGGSNIDLWEATADSVNVVFAQLALQVGPESIANAARAAGVDQSELCDTCPSITLGSSAVSPLEMASAYSTFAREGEACPSYVIQKIVGPSPNDEPKGELLYDREHAGRSMRCAEVFTPDIANLITAMLQGVIEHGTGTAASLGAREVAGKTGTSQDSADLWFVGYVPQYATAVWVGNPVGRVPYEGEFGGTAAAPIWQAFMTAILRGVPSENFAAPGQIKGKQAEVPDVVGDTEEEATRKIQLAKFAVNVNEVDDKGTEGTVVGQSPSGGSKAEIGSSVTIDVSTGKAPEPKVAVVPNVIGEDEGGASSILQRAGFDVNVNHVDSAKPRGMVIGQSPRGGEKAGPGDTVTIDVSTGRVPPKPVAVPNVVGEDVSSAEATLKAAGFKVSISFKQIPHPGQDGKVLSQSPSGGTADEHSTVSIVVGKF